MRVEDFCYLDYVSTTPLDQEVFNMYSELLKRYYANCDSLHDPGVEVRRLQEKSRNQIAVMLGVEPEEVIFTSGATESNNMAVKGIAMACRDRGRHIITSAVEHSSIMSSFEQLRDQFGFEVTFLPVNDRGQVELTVLKQALRKDTTLVSIMMVNNELGSINPIAAIADYVKHNSQAYFHVDAVQALGKLPLDLRNIDVMSLSMHKIFGLNGSGLLIKKRHVEMLPLISAGQQEFGWRGGTSNAVVNIMAAKTLRLALNRREGNYKYVSELRERLLTGLRDINGLLINSPADGSPFIISIAYPRMTSEVMLNALNECGIAVSAQSTCHSKSKNLSHVYQAMHYDQQRAAGIIRIGLDYPVTRADIERFITEMKRIIVQYG